MPLEQQTLHATKSNTFVLLINNIWTVFIRSVSGIYNCTCKQFKLLCMNWLKLILINYYQLDIGHTCLLMFFFGVNQDTCGPRYFLFVLD